mmetsp:Transcript_27638/g.40823  ORF Transcript_27638/g.40823 Transcript_27638/m.40823 type:complete len:89 (+) Transcript_27638:604-870(+)
MLIFAPRLGDTSSQFFSKARIILINVTNLNTSRDEFFRATNVYTQIQSQTKKIGRFAMSSNIYPNGILLNWLVMNKSLKSNQLFAFFC